MIKNRHLTISGKKLVLFILYFTLIMETLIVELHFPRGIRYINDIAIIMLLIFIDLKKINSVFKSIKCTPIIISIISFFLVCIITSIINMVSPFLVIWATRNTFRGIIYFLAAVIFLEKEDLSKIFNILFWIQIINAILASYQCFILHHRGDLVGGIFGYGNGAGINLFQSLLVAYYINGFLNKKEKLHKVIIIILSSFLIDAMAEEKANIILIAVILFVSIFYAKLSYKKIMTIIIGTTLLVVGLNLTQYFYPKMKETLLDSEKFMDYATTTYDRGYRIPRLGAFKVISKEFFNNQLSKKLIGIGFGNGDTSEIKIFQSDFYKKYGYWNYRWFTDQWIFTETGYIGFTTYMLVFFTILICLVKSIKNVNKEQKIYLVTSICTTITSIILIWHSSALQIDMQYLAYFSVALGFIALKDVNKKKLNEGEKKNDT